MGVIRSLKVDEVTTMKLLLIFSTLLICALGYRVVPNHSMHNSGLKPDYLRKCVNASIIAIESYDKNGNNGLSFDEIKDIPDLAVSEDSFKQRWDMNQDGELDLAELITNVYMFSLVQ